MPRLCITKIHNWKIVWYKLIGRRKIHNSVKTSFIHNKVWRLFILHTQYALQLNGDWTPAPSLSAPALRCKATHVSIWNGFTFFCSLKLIRHLFNITGGCVRKSDNIYVRKRHVKRLYLFKQGHFSKSLY